MANWDHRLSVRHFRTALALCLLTTGIVLGQAGQAPRSRSHIAFEEFRARTLEQREDVLYDLKRVERLVEMDRRGLLEEEQAWARQMAELCGTDPDFIRHWSCAIEFQRHAGRTARFRGALEEALDEYERALEVMSRACRFAPEPDKCLTPWDQVIFRDIADTYVLMGAFDEAEALLWWANDQVRKQQAKDSPPDLCRLADIARLRGQMEEAVDLQQRAIDPDEHHIITGLAKRYPQIPVLADSTPWPQLVRHPSVRDILDAPDFDPTPTNVLRDRYCGLATLRRLAGQLDEAEHALETAELTPWRSTGLYQVNFDLSVERELAWLALARGRHEEVLERSDACLADHDMTPTDRAELHELASKALEGAGDLEAALDRLSEAIEIVEERRGRLSEDANRQMYLAFCAPLYRRACDLAVRAGLDPAETFEWSERAKARAMLDTMHRYDPTRAWGVTCDESESLCTAVARADLQAADWWSDDLALLEYAYGQGDAYLWVVTKTRSSFHKLGASRHEIEKQAAALRDALGPGASLNDDWVKPAEWLYRQLVAPADRDLQGITRLIIVGDGRLCEIPFETLIARRNANPRRKALPHELLIERYAISYAPSATLLDHVARRPEPKEWRWDFWGAAVSNFEPPEAKADAPSSVRRAAKPKRLGNLRSAPFEIDEAAGRFPKGRSRLFKDRPGLKRDLLEASRKGELRSVRFLHFATHAIADADAPHLSGLVLATPPKDMFAAATQPTTSAPSPLRGFVASSLRGPPVSHDWLLTLPDISQLNLRCELVVLSACHSLGDRLIDGDWLNGLARSFLLAGSSGVLCTLWEVPDRGALSLTPALYHALLNDAHAPGSRRDIPRALQKVKITRLGSPMLSHPATWSAFIHIGGGAR